MHPRPLQGNNDPSRRYDANEAEHPLETCCASKFEEHGLSEPFLSKRTLISRNRLRANRFQLGDRVVAFVGYGGYTTDLVVKEDSVAPLPPGMDLVTGASFVSAYGTADYALRVGGQKRGGVGRDI